jgi:hypothetical protein
VIGHEVIGVEAQSAEFVDQKHAHINCANVCPHSAAERNDNEQVVGGHERLQTQRRCARGRGAVHHVIIHAQQQIIEQITACDHSAAHSKQGSEKAWNRVSEKGGR